MKIVSIKMPEELVELIDILVSTGRYTSRSEVIREAVRQLVRDYMRTNTIEAKNTIRDETIKVKTIEIEPEQNQQHTQSQHYC